MPGWGTWICVTILLLLNQDKNFNHNLILKNPQISLLSSGSEQGRDYQEFLAAWLGAGFLTWQWEQDLSPGVAAMAKEGAACERLTAGLDHQSVVLQSAGRGACLSLSPCQGRRSPWWRMEGKLHGNDWDLPGAHTVLRGGRSGWSQPVLGLVPTGRPTWSWAPGVQVWRASWAAGFPRGKRKHFLPCRADVKTKWDFFFKYVKNLAYSSSMTGTAVIE